MKTKLWIQNRIFITFFLFIIFVVNIFSYFLYIGITQKFRDTIIKNIENEYQTITHFIDIQKENIFVLWEYEMKHINSLWFFFSLWNNDETLQLKYKIWIHYYDNKNIIFRWDYKGYNIIIGKNIEDLLKIQNQFIELVLLLDVFLVGVIFLITYFLTINLLKPIWNISNFIKDYDIYRDSKWIQNEYWDSEIWKYIDSTNSFIVKIKDIFHSQKDFIQDVSHELKTPLMQIDSSIEILENKITDEKILLKLKNIRSAVTNINNIISNLSFLLRGEEINTQKEIIHFTQYFTHKWVEYETIASKKNIKINILSQNDLVIESNVYYIDRLFDNIIMNAIFYNNGNNEIQVIIWAKSIKIIDRGIGIKEENLKKIFERFYRHDQSVLYSESGSWLGLSIVKKITDMFGWKINIVSQEWVGTEFEIIFLR